MNGPPPTKQVFLSELATLPLHSKVRFLGCVSRYDISTGRLILEHKYPTTSKTTTTSTTTVPVDINLLLETVKAEDLQVGAWLNVLGYVRENSSKDDDSRNHDRASNSAIYVEAVMIVPAGPVNVGEYERILRDAQEVDRRVRRPPS
ncbi:hypothetical protein VTN77DRAFT_9609 [Rasamsonia byssochlamydoides]|uniref:uncharacterized protein n=1 Tax=Rasamsonia byssochlamydoides TaxID=89139 RepID=UPI00374247B2